MDVLKINGDDDDDETYELHIRLNKNLNPCISFNIISSLSSITVASTFVRSD